MATVDVTIYKSLWNAARNVVTPAFRDNDDAVRACRDQICSDMFGRGYRELTTDEITAVIAALETRTKPVVSAEKMRTLLYYAMTCALHYAKSDQVFVDEHGARRTFNELREQFKSAFVNHQKLPTGVTKILYSNWMNPKSNEFLVAGGFKKTVKKPEFLKYNNLTDAEATYLINRYRMIFENVSNKQQPNINHERN